MRTILKWAGNKTAIMPELLKHLPKGPRLVEPFAGSCAVMMATDYPYYLVADINPDLINMYKVIASQTREFIAVSRDCFHRFNSQEGYNLIRNRFNSASTLSHIQRAAYFLFLNRHCYRGLCRYNRSGSFNVPYGNYKNPYLPENEIFAFAEKARYATFVCASYEKTLTMLRDGDVVYCDPPYDGTFTDYHSAGFGDDEQYHLASVLVRRASEGHPIVVSNSDTLLTRSLYRDFTCHKVTARRSMGVSAGEGKSATEIIATKSARWFGVDFARDSARTVEVRV